MTYGGNTQLPMCITDFAGSIVQEYCAPGSNLASNPPQFGQYDQQFNLHSDGTMHLINQSGFDYGCLDIYANDPTNGQLDIAPCNGSQAQNWSYSIFGELMPVHHPAYCVDVLNGSQANLATIGLAPCNGGLNLEQIFLPLNYSVEIVSYNSPTVDCFNIPFNDAADGAAVINYPCSSGAVNEWFAFEPASTQANGFAAMLWSQAPNGVNNCFANTDMLNGLSGGCNNPNSFLCLASCGNEGYTADVSSLFSYESTYNGGVYTLQLQNAWKGFTDFCVVAGTSPTDMAPFYGGRSFYLNWAKTCSRASPMPSEQMHEIQLVTPFPTSTQ